MAGELLALEAIILAAEGHTQEAVAKAEAALRTTRTGEVRVFANAALVACLVDSQPSDSPIASERTQELWVSALNEDMIDPLVIACRSLPVLVKWGSIYPLSYSVVEVVRSRAADPHVLAPTARGGLPASTHRLSALTPRELQVLQLIGEGLSNSDIASQLVIAKTTARVHTRNVLRKLQVRSRLQAAVLWTVHQHGDRSGPITTDDPPHASH
jgi:ATP/maltotriose-dependent transcriptional regulator MalT